MEKFSETPCFEDPMEETSLTPRFADWGLILPTEITRNSGSAAAVSTIDVLGGLPIFKLRNGTPQSITAFLSRASPPLYAHWVPIAGMRHEDALKCTDLFIRSHVWNVMRSRRSEWTDDQCRKIGFILGVARAVCCHKFQISAEDLNSNETTTPVFSVSYGEDDNATPEYMCVAEDPRTATERKLNAKGQPFVADPRSILFPAFEMTPDEKAVLPALAKSAHAIIPLQGYGLIIDGHHYLSEKGTAIYRAFWAVERQHWVGARVSAYMEDYQLDVRDILWHKAGHPVSIAVKKIAATSQLVADNLKAADLGSAGCRLPAVEPDARAIHAYLRVTDAVRSSIESCGGKVNNTLLKEINAALAHFPLPILADTPGYKAPEPMVLGAVKNTDGTRSDGVRVASRNDVLAFAKDLISRSDTRMAVCFGYYMAMLDAGENPATGGEDRHNSLVYAPSLRRLKTERVGAFNDGMKYYKEMQSVRAKTRKEGTP